jgi:hypothetical protein
VSWSNVVQTGYVATPYVSLVHGALTTYDLPDLVGAIEGKVRIDEPLDALRRPVKAKP